MSDPDPSASLIHDWVLAGPHRFEVQGRVMLNDETLRDGLQSPSVTDPPAERKVEILHLMNRLGIETACVGLPGAGERQRADAERLCLEMARERLRITPNCAGRTLQRDIEPMADIAQRTGAPVEACVFIGSSPIRLHTEGWEMERLLRHTADAVAFGVKQGLKVMYVTEDTVRTPPATLEPLLRAAVEAGASRVCLCDTAGAAIPEGVMNLVGWVAGLLQSLGAGEVGIDWHGHRDRGLGLANTLAAVRAGASRVHGAGLAAGERVGNTAMELLLVNLRLLGLRDDDLGALPAYAEAVSAALGIPIPPNAPVVGQDAFRTATGVHAAAVIKARERGDAWMADNVYSGVPASWIGREQVVDVGPMSGASNVRHALGRLGLPATERTVTAVLRAAKSSDRVLSEAQIRQAADAAPRSTLLGQDHHE